MTDTAVKAWRFATDSVPPAVRAQTWLKTLDRLCLPVAQLPELPCLSGEALFLQSALGTEVSRLAAGPHEFVGSYQAQAEGVWLSLLLEGDAVLFHEGEPARLSVDDIVYAPTGRAASLRFTSAFRQLFIKLPMALLGSQALAPADLYILRIRRDDGVGQVFLSMLRTLGASLCHIGSEELRPVELSIREFLVSRCAREHFNLSQRSSSLQRVCRTIEVRLSDPELSLEDVAEANGISTRYLQKLFAEEGDTFRAYRLRRRLERARADLLSPLCLSLSITEICFRWGFNDPAHFSRSFRKAFGQSPRACRLAALQRWPAPRGRLNA
jgi:AraC-like DNA-binding protein